MKRIFLGGTTKGWDWRAYIKRQIEVIGLSNISYFDPIVDDWNEEAQLKEVEEKKNCDFCLYVITPWISGVYSIAEAVEDACLRKSKAVFVLLEKMDCIMSVTEERIAGVNNSSLDCCGYTDSYGWYDSIPSYDSQMVESLFATKRLIERNGGTTICGMNDLIGFLKYHDHLDN